MKRLWSLLYLLLLAGCAKQYGYDSVGLFAPQKRVHGQQYFMTSRGNSNIELKKLTDCELCYYVWKTVKSNYKVDDEESFSSFKTLLNHELDHISPEDIAYVQNPKNLLNNYLFFIDDYRCIYFSEDDKRDEESLGKIPLYFDDKTYKIDRKKYGSRMDQVIRGYYKLEGNNIFLDFGGVRHFYIKGTATENVVEFKEIHIPESELVKTDGINNNYVPFKSFLKDEALPIFEVPQNDAIREPNFLLVSGLRSKTKKLPKKNPLELSLMNLYPSWSQKEEEDEILSITYDLNSNPPKRVYEIEIFQAAQLKYDTLLLEEPLDTVRTW